MVGDNRGERQMDITIENVQTGTRVREHVLDSGIIGQRQFCCFLCHLCPIRFQAAFNSPDKLDRPHRLQPDLMPLRRCSRNLERIPGQDRGLDVEIGGFVSDGYPLPIRESPIRDDQSVAIVRKPLQPLRDGAGEIDEVSGSAEDMHQQIGGVPIILDEKNACPGDEPSGRTINEPA